MIQQPGTGEVTGPAAPVKEVITVTKVFNTQVDLGHGLVMTQVVVRVPASPIVWDAGERVAWLKIQLNGILWLGGLGVIRRGRSFFVDSAGEKGTKRFFPFVVLTAGQKSAILGAVLPVIQELRKVTVVS